MFVNKKSQITLGRAASSPLTSENNYATKSPLVTMGSSTFTPKTALPFRRSPPPSNTPLPRLTALHPKWHPDPISCFATVHFPDAQTDIQTEIWDRRQTCKNTRLRSIDCIATHVIIIIFATFHMYVFTVVCYPITTHQQNERGAIF